MRLVKIHARRAKACENVTVRMHNESRASCAALGGWMVDLPFYVLFNSISIISGR